ncbi:transcription factor grauzone [Drosophila grimshawi]|uniref:GH20315 n=1 Tax=Drosophila grimshawi TaxID=7222 RepID=B4J4Z2_DROGR|nr:transcription factor grauzone [Drosophila grimshawi]EDW01698.1 GH20315 [Drosophila grimshawi]
MAACVLCFDCCKTGESYKIFSEAGLRLKICKTINKHFWLELSNAAGGEREEICHQCWQVVSNFNKLYERVYNLHQERLCDVKNVTIEFCDEAEAANPLALGGELDALAEDFFASGDVKVEVNELEPLPKLEMLDEPVVEEQSRASKRTSAERSAAKRRIKNEQLTISSDSDGDIPLAEFLDLKTTAKPGGVVAAASPLIGRQLRRSTRRGRREKTPSESPSTSLKKESESDDADPDGDDNNDNDQDMDFVAAEAVLGTEDSASSSESSDGDSGDSLPDVEPEERYAEIPKRVVVKPKKYRKRPKPLVAPVRMSRDDLAKRRAQQKKYDEIIFEFFKKLPCHVCNLLVPNFGDMRRHLRMSHNIESGFIACCGRKFHIRRGLAEHVLVHNNPEHFMCAPCGRVFQDSKTLEAHEQTHTNPMADAKDKRIYPCDKCPKTFTTKAAVEYHIMSKHVPKSDFKYTCPECNKKLPTERKLKEHRRYMHDPETAIICDKCGKTLRTQANLKKHHELEHSDEPRPKPDPVQCEICGTWLRHLSGLKQHMKTVHEPPCGEHRCPICDKTSTNSRALKRHIYHNHQCERKFRCTMCEKAFKRPQDLREHTSTHTGEVLYTCPNCPQTFFSNANMYKHRQRLHRAEWEADRKKPLPPNIMQQAAMKKRQGSKAAAPTLFPPSAETPTAPAAQKPESQQQPQQQLH